jgi:hypothetical protein
MRGPFLFGKKYTMKEKYDTNEFYCPKLGHHLSFKYCRTENLGLPCSRIIKCCSDKIPVQNFLTTHYAGEEIQQILKRPEPKINTILDIIRKMNKNDT